MPIVGEITRHDTLYLENYNEKKPNFYFRKTQFFSRI